ncbi:MAG: BatD family protein [Planctomycetota bacterium]|nr:BatD family protein [Planctomycetota bacterium]
MIRIAHIAALCAIAWSLFAPASSAQSATINARLTATVVKLGGDAKLVVEVENAADASIGTVPEVKGVRFGPVGSPAVEQFFSIHNGRQTQSRSLRWVISVQPLAKGEYTIPPIPITVDGRKFATRELAFKAVEDIQGDEFGLFEIDAPKEVVEGQPFTVEMRFGWDSALTRQINYAKLSVPWLGGLAGLLELDPPPVAPGIQTTPLLLNERSRVSAEQVGEQKVAGKAFFVLRVRKRFIATRSGPLTLPTSDFEFGRAAQEGFFSRPDAGVSYYKRSPSPLIEVTKLPIEGQPVEYSGAVGNLQVQATADRRQVDVGDSIKLTVDWSGSGNLEFFTPPDVARLDAFKGFRTYGTNDRKSFERRSVTYDIAPLSPDVKEIPAVPLVVFDLATKSYKTLSTAPIPISVAPLKNASTLSEDAGARDVQIDIRDIQTRPERGDGGSGPSSGVLVATSGLMLVGWIAVRTSVRKRGDPNSALARGRRRARAALTRDLAVARTATDESRALRVFLAARTGEPSEAFVGRDFVAWASARPDSGGLAGALADVGSEVHAITNRTTPIADPALTALQRLTAQLDERTWNGNDERLGADAITSVADALVKGGL